MTDLSPLAPAPLDLDRLFGALAGYGVRYVVIGGAALNLLGVGLLTEDVDICYEASQANTRALARALRSLRPIPVGADLRPLGSEIDARALQLHDNLLFLTAGALRRPRGGQERHLYNDQADVAAFFAALDGITPAV